MQGMRETHNYLSHLLDDPNVGLLFPAKAKHYLSLTSGGLGIVFKII